MLTGPFLPLSEYLVATSATPAPGQAPLFRDELEFFFGADELAGVANFCDERAFSPDSTSSEKKFADSLGFILGVRLRELFTQNN
jgi:hypothetical protein